jgi:hypothetical protein
MATVTDSRREWPLIVATVTLSIVIVGIVGYQLLEPPRQPTLVIAPTRVAAPTATPGSVELWKAYEQARQAAEERWPDATLVSASTQWQRADEQALLAGAVDWSFVFYSPEKRSTLDVVCAPGSVQVVKETRAWVAPGALDEGNWRAGPRDALLAFLAYGGRAFLTQHPEAVVGLNLGPDEENSPVWAVVALDGDDGSVLGVSVDAETGSIVAGGL